MYIYMYIYIYIYIYIFIAPTRSFRNCQKLLGYMSSANDRG